MQVFGWVPEPFNNDTCTPEKQLETGCPTTVAPNHIAVTCEGEVSVCIVVIIIL